MAFVKFDNVAKTYHMGEVEIHALKNATFEVEKGELVVLPAPEGPTMTTSSPFSTSKVAFFSAWISTSPM